MKIKWHPKIKVSRKEELFKLCETYIYVRALWIHKELYGLNSVCCWFWLNAVTFSGVSGVQACFYKVKLIIWSTSRWCIHDRCSWALLTPESFFFNSIVSSFSIPGILGESTQQIPVSFSVLQVFIPVCSFSFQSLYLWSLISLSPAGIHILFEITVIKKMSNTDTARTENMWLFHRNHE